MQQQQNADAVTDRFIRPAELYGIIGLGKTAVRALESRGEFPRRRRIAASAVGWLASEVTTWMTARAQVVIAPDRPRASTVTHANA